MRIRPILVYADTSVYGGLHDEEFVDATTAFFSRVEQGEIRLLSSPLVIAELQDAPQAVRDSYARLNPLVEATTIDDETLALRDAYIDAGVVTSRWKEDALHVAVATVNSAELIVSWNFRHIVNYDRIRGYQAVNLLNGYRAIEIRTPREVLGDEDEDV